MRVPFQVGGEAGLGHGGFEAATVFVPRAGSAARGLGVFGHHGAEGRAVAGLSVHLAGNRAPREV